MKYTIIMAMVLLMNSLSNAQEQWEIVTGCMGGVTGGGGGFLVTNDGQVFEWQSLTPAKISKKLLGQMERQTVTELRSRLEEIAFKKIEFNKPSNMSCFLKLQDASSEHKLVWPIGGPFPPKEVIKVFNKIEELAKHYKKTQ